MTNLFICWEIDPIERLLENITAKNNRGSSLSGIKVTVMHTPLFQRSWHQSQAVTRSTTAKQNIATTKCLIYRNQNKGFIYSHKLIAGAEA